MALLSRLLLLACGLRLWGPAAGQRMPECRKSPELHALSMAEGKKTTTEVVAFGGKGWGWKPAKGNSSGDVWSPPGGGRLLEAEEAEQEEEEGGRRRKEPKNVSLAERALPGRSAAPPRLRQKVAFYDDTWVFSMESKSWTRVKFHKSSPIPVSRWKPSSTEFDDGARMALFGGCHGTDVSGVLNDLWVLTLSSPGSGTWTQILTQNPPRARRGHITVANETHLIVAGGKGWTASGGTEVLTDLWILPLSALRKTAHSMDSALARKNSPSWVAGHPFPARPRWGTTGELLNIGKGKQVIAYFGGRNQNEGAAFHSTAAGAYTYFNDLWLYHFAEDKWEQAKPEGKLPHVRDHHGAASIGTDLFVFAGRTSEMRAPEATLNDLWSYSTVTNRWTLHKEGKSAPCARFMPGVTILPDAENNKSRVVIFAGETFPKHGVGSTRRSSMNDVWAYDVEKGRKGSWREVVGLDCSAEATAKEKLLAPEEKLAVEPAGAAHWPLYSAPVLAGCALVAALSTVAVERHRRSRSVHLPTVPMLG